MGRDRAEREVDVLGDYRAEKGLRRIEEGIAYSTPEGDKYAPWDVFERVRAERDAAQQQLAGAVEALERIVYPGEAPHSNPPTRAEMVRLAQAALARLGGAS